MTNMMNASTTRVYAWVIPGLLLLANKAVVIEMHKMPPDCRNMPRRPAICATISGASCRVALLVVVGPPPYPAR